MNKFKQFISKKYQSVLSNAAEGMTDIILKRDDYLESIKNVDEINKFYDYFYQTILKMLIYLRDDYDQIRDNYDSDINTEIKLIQKHYKQHTKKTLTNSTLRVFNMKKYKLLIGKWSGISQAHKELSKLMPHFENITGYSVYKDIDFTEIHEHLRQSSYLVRSFDYYKVESKKVAISG